MIIPFPREQLLTSFSGLKWCKDELRKSPGTAAVALAKRWHDLMAPIPHSGNSPYVSVSPGNKDSSEGGKETRSIFRRTMCQKIEQEAKAVCKQLVKIGEEVSYPFIYEGIKLCSQVA